MDSSALILHSDGNFSNIPVPRTAQELTSLWKNEYYFASGVTFHKMIHLSEIIKTKLIGKSNKTLSLALLKNKEHSCNSKDCNFHELPQGLDTQLFYGNLMIILTLDGTNIINLSPIQYKNIVDADLEMLNSTTTTNSSFSSSPIARETLTPFYERGHCVKKDVSFLNDEYSVDDMDISS